MVSNTWLAQCQLRYGNIVKLAEAAALAYKQGQNVDLLNKQVEEKVSALSPDERRELYDFVQKLAWTKSVNLGVIRLICPERYLFTAAICKAIAVGINFNIFRVAESTRNTINLLESRAKKAKKKGDFGFAATLYNLAAEVKRYTPAKWLAGENNEAASA
jgi:hypothetical protein